MLHCRHALPSLSIPTGLHPCATRAMTRTNRAAADVAQWCCRRGCGKASCAGDAPPRARTWLPGRHARVATVLDRWNAADDDLRRARTTDPAPARCGALARGHHRAPSGAAAAGQPHRPVPALHRADAGQVPDADGRAAVRHGVRARLPGLRQPLPPPRGRHAGARAGAGVSAAAHTAGRADADGLGPLRPSADRPRAAPADGLRDGLELLTRRSSASTHSVRRTCVCGTV